MNDKNDPLFLEKIHLSWIPYLRSLHWSGKLDTFLGKSYASFKLTDQEKSKWSISGKDINRINEVLQSVIDNTNATAKINDFLECLSSVELLNIPNTLDSQTLLIDEVKKESPELIEKLKTDILSFISPIKNIEFNKLAILYKRWDGRHVQTTHLRGASLVTELLTESGTILNFPDINSFNSINVDVQPFMLLVYYFFDKTPDISRISLFRELLLRENDNLTSAIDRIMYPSWREFSDLMYKLTQSWINSLNPILIDWLIHGVEVPGRKDPQKAFNFLKSAFYLANENVALIISHVTATIICADPYQSLNTLDKWLTEKKAEKIKERIMISLADIITDKFKNNNYDQYDFPDLQNVLTKLMSSWIKSEKKIKNEIGNDFIEKINN